jgi:hypothetical protein
MNKMTELEAREIDWNRAPIVFKKAGSRPVLWQTMKKGLIFKSVQAVPAYATGSVVLVKTNSGIRPFAEINTVETSEGRKCIDNIWFPTEYPPQLTQQIANTLVPKIRMKFPEYRLPGDA